MRKINGRSAIGALAALAAALTLMAGAAYSQVRATAPNSVGPRIGTIGPISPRIGLRDPNFFGSAVDRPTKNPDTGATRPPKRPTGHNKPPRRPNGPTIVVLPPGGFGPPPDATPPHANPPPPPRPPRVSRPNTPLPNARPTGVPPANERRYVPDEVIIQVTGTPPQPVVDALAQRFRLARIESMPYPLTNNTIFRWRIPDSRSVPAVIRELERSGAVQFASPNYLYSLSQTEMASAPAAAPFGDPAQYALGKLHLAKAHHLAKGGEVLVAVIDSGIDKTHPELADVIADSYDALKSDEPPHAHGTAVAGAIVAHARLRGVAPDAQVLAVRAFGESKKGAEGTTFSILKGIDWAVTKGARVINMSFAGPKDPALSRVLEAADKKNIILIAAAGNAGAKSPPLYPAADPNVIAVTATDADDKLFDASNRGSHVAVAAPGVDILLPSTEGSYQVTSGTSFAAAHISGIAALLVERRRDLDTDAVRKILIATAKDLGPKGRDKSFGAGLADAYQALISPDVGGPVAATEASAAR